MRMDKFISTYFKTHVDYDGMYGYQCVDLFRQYCHDVLNIPHTGGVEFAKDLWLNYETLPIEKKYFERIKRNVQVGDVAIWNSTPGNVAGHVAIVIGNMPGRDLLVIEQNGITQNGVEIKIRTIDNILGYLRFRG